MRCPRCSELAPEGAAICDNCQEILDASFLGEEEVTPVEGDKTDVGPAPTSGRRPDRLKKAAGNRYLAEPVQAVASPLDEARRAAGDLSSFFRSLAPWDRWAAGASAALLALLALPWRWTKADDEIIGLVAAWPVAILAGAVLLVIYLRARRADAAQDRSLRLAQLAASGACALYTGLFLPYTSQSHSLRAAGHGLSVATSAPQIGAYLGLVCALAALAASLRE